MSPEETIPAPFSFAPSQLWDGNDGRWSSFIVRVGTPAQDFRVFPSTAGQETIIPLAQGCTASDPNDCGSSRGIEPAFGMQGTGYLTNDSTTWDLIGLYTSNLEDTLGYTVNAEYGFDTIGLEIENSGGLTLNQSIVAGIAAKDFYLGIFGLGPKPSNFTTFDDPKPSFMKLLNSTKLIPSLSYGYTAGAVYGEIYGSLWPILPLTRMLIINLAFSGVLGSLTLGGYDSSRFEPTDLVVSFASDDSRPLQVPIQTITGESTLAGTQSLLPTPVYANIDSTLPYLWLPEAACDNFATAFGLTYDNDTDLYVINDTIHTQLTSLNPTVTFKIGNSIYNGVTQNIMLPYAAFDLNASYPIYANTTRYFPIRRAANDTQYTLGRTFLQEAYVIADYENKNFTVAQANFSATMPTSQIVPIVSSGYNPRRASNGSGLSSGAIAGIAVGAVLVVALGIIGILICLHRRKRQTRRAATSADDSVTDIKETRAEGLENELTTDSAKHELPSRHPHHELHGSTAKWGGSGVQELYSDIPNLEELGDGALAEPPKWIHEAEGSPGRVFELPGTESDR